MNGSWISEHLPLDRPEYAKQSEALLTDLLWRSRGSTLSEDVKWSGRTDPLLKLVPLQRPQGRKADIVETFLVAEEIDLDGLVSIGENTPNPVKAILNSIIAPKARQDKSLACVPMDPSVVALQTLHGIVNKPGPPNVARIIETVGWLGGSAGEGSVAHSFLSAMQSKGISDPSFFLGFINSSLPLLAGETWAGLVKGVTDNKGKPLSWPGIAPREVDKSRGPSVFGLYHDNTPYKWFWNKWKTLCDPGNDWFDILPPRRFTDWATCLLRTGLSFAFLWEAEFFVRLHACLVEEMQVRRNPDQDRNCFRILKHSLSQGFTLATFESIQVPATQKHSWNAIQALLSRGHLIRKRIEQHLRETPNPLDSTGTSDFADFVLSWSASLSDQSLEELASPIDIDRNRSVSPNTEELVRYLLRPRLSDDDTQDQADFYYLALTNKARRFWFQPGPEWLVVLASLLSSRPGGKCTLGMLLNDLRMLGVQVDRWVLVEMLEDAGLSTDSPDADNALVIHAGF